MAKSLLTIIFIFLSNIFFNLYGSHGRMIGDASNIVLKTVYGDEYNCVDIYKQPAFDHPELKNHKIPTEFIRELEEEKYEYAIHPKNIWLEGRGCPKGTVPLRRVTNSTAQPTFSPPSTVDFKVGEKGIGLECTDNTKPTTQPSNTETKWDFAGIEANPRPGNNYYGASAWINAYNPKLKGNDETSSAMINVEDAATKAFIQVGWTVNPQIYNGDTRTRLYTGWGPGGCFNALCPGYVQVDPVIPVDLVLPNISEWERTQYSYSFELFLHRNSGNWYYSAADQKIIMGYWPKELSKGLLENGAGLVTWGGVVSSLNNVSPQMGSGKFKNGAYDQTCFMRKVKVMDQNSAIIDPDGSFITGIDSRCYFEGDHGFDSNPDWNYRFLFGGAGGKDCYDCLY